MCVGEWGGVGASRVLGLGRKVRVYVCVVEGGSVGLKGLGLGQPHGVVNAMRRCACAPRFGATCDLDCHDICFCSVHERNFPVNICTCHGHHQLLVLFCSVHESNLSVNIDICHGSNQLLLAAAPDRTHMMCTFHTYTNVTEVCVPFAHAFDHRFERYRTFCTLFGIDFCFCTCIHLRAAF